MLKNENANKGFSATSGSPKGPPPLIDYIVSSQYSYVQVLTLSTWGWGGCQNGTLLGNRVFTEVLKLK